MVGTAGLEVGTEELEVGIEELALGTAGLAAGRWPSRAAVKGCSCVVPSLSSSLVPPRRAGTKPVVLGSASRMLVSLHQFEVGVVELVGTVVAELQVLLTVALQIYVLLVGETSWALCSAH